jgi:nucleotide-binding universal stress UspA family protein
MKVKPTKHPGEVILELHRRDVPMMVAASLEANLSPFRLKRILVPIDFSECSRKALRYAAPLAKQHSAEIDLLYVLSADYRAAEYNGIENAWLEADLRAAGEKQLAQLAASEVQGEVHADTLVRIGAPAEEIIAAAKQRASDLIVISTHGHTGLRHVFLGSVAEKVVRHAPCPVLVVREWEREFVRG